MKIDRKESARVGIKVLRDESVVRESEKHEKKQKKSEHKEDSDFKPLSFRDED